MTLTETGFKLSNAKTFAAANKWADGNFIYLLNELSLSVTTFSYDKENGKAKRFSCCGKYVCRGNDSITCYEANPSTGKLTVTEVEPIRGAWPRNINIDPSSKWILAAGAHSNTIAVHKIDPENGSLTFQTRSIISVPGPICILFAK